MTERELTRLIMKHTCTDETKTEEAESLTPEQDARQDRNLSYFWYACNINTKGI